MRRIATFFLSLSLIVGLSFLAGCDSGGGGNGNGDTGPDPAISIDRDQVDLTVPGGASTSDTAQFTVNFTSLDNPPSASGSGDLTVNSASEGDGQKTFNVFYNGSVASVTDESVTVTGSAGDSTLTDSLSATVSPGFIATSFSPTFSEPAHFEDDTVTVSGPTQIKRDSLTENVMEDVSENTNGVASLQIDASSDGSVTVERTASAPNADRFTFLVLPDPSTSFDLTLTFNEEADGGTASHEVTLPVESGDSWLEYTVQFDQLGDFNPVASRAGGNGPFTSVEFSANSDVTYHIDDLFFATESKKLVDINDFEETTGAYGPPFCPPEFSYSDDVAENSDGFRSRRVQGEGCFGYNYGGGLGPPAWLYLDLSGSDVVSFYAKGSSGDSLDVFLETIDADGDDTNDGEFSTDNSKTVALPSSWEKIEVPIDSLGNDPAALLDPGLRNIGFNAVGENADIFIDDIKIEQSGN